MEKQFIQGMYAKKPSERAPAFIKCNLSLRRVEVIKYLQSLTDENVNIKILESKNNPEKWYAELDTYKAPQKQNTMTSVAPNGEQIDTREIPF